MVAAAGGVPRGFCDIGEYMDNLISRRSLLVSAFALASTPSAKALRAEGTRATESVVLVTTLGNISLSVDRRAPRSAASFLEYADRHLLDGTQFYRSVHPENDSNPVKISVLQGGMTNRTHALPPIPHESTQQTGLRHLDGAISIARRELGTGIGGIFFICIGDQPELDFGGRRNPDGQGFAVFGRVNQGTDLVRRIWGQPTVGTDGSIAAQRISSPVDILSVARK
jgi:peptidyl-prolyl cis-trans isomerase A (cyclophilin A)